MCLRVCVCGVCVCVCIPDFDRRWVRDPGVLGFASTRLKFGFGWLTAPRQSQSGLWLVRDVGDVEITMRFLLFLQPSMHHHEMASGHHHWYVCSHARPTYCNVCREALSGVTSHGLSCEGKKTRFWSHSRRIVLLDSCTFGDQFEEAPWSQFEVTRICAVARSPVCVISSLRGGRDDFTVFCVSRRLLPGWRLSKFLLFFFSVQMQGSQKVRREGEQQLQVDDAGSHRS